MGKVKLQGEWKSRTYEGLSPSDIDWARLAAFIDGEGSVLINPRSHGSRRADDPVGASTFYLKVTVANTDVRLLEWLKANFGGHWKEANSEKYNAGRNVKNCYHWNAASARAAWMLYNCLPWFLIKGEQAQIGIALQESMNKFIRGSGVSKRIPDEIVAERRDLKRRLLIMKARGKTIPREQQERIEAVS